MKFGKIIGQAVSTRKEKNLEGKKLSVIRYLDDKLNETKKTAVSLDTVKANTGDVVLICTSSSARMTRMTRSVCTDSTIVAIVDSISQNKNDWYKKKKTRKSGGL